MNQFIAMFRNALGVPSTVTLDAAGNLPTTATVAPGGIVGADLRVNGAAVTGLNPVPVTIGDGDDVAQGTTADAEAPVGNGTVIAILKRIRTLLSGGLPVALGQGTMAEGMKVTLANNQSALPVTAAQATHNNLNGNMTVQQADVDVGIYNPLQVIQGMPFTVVLGIEALATSTMYQLIELINSINYPHALRNAIILKKLRLHVEKAADGVYDIWVGVVTAVDATKGSASWLHCFHLEATGNPTDSTDRFAQELEFNLDLGVDTGVLEYYRTNMVLANTALLQTDVILTSPVGSGVPGVGDLVVYVEEVSGTGTIDFVISAGYQTR